ncbi:hypothetical protein M8A54_004171 [Salmonella enterica]|nr:hypothetical protein [Salmonella enterica]
MGLVSATGTLIAYGSYPDTFLPAQTDAVVKEVILTLELDPHVMILTQEAGDKCYLQKPVSGETVELAVSYGTVTTVPEGYVQTGLRLDAEGHWCISRQNFTQWRKRIINLTGGRWPSLHSPHYPH